MSQHTQTFSASGTFTASSVLLGGTVSVDVRGAAGGGGLLRGGVGGAGGRVQGVVTLAASGTLAITVGVHQNGYSGGGGVGGGNSGYGGGSSAVVKSGTLLVEAGGGGGAGTTTTGGAGGGGGRAGGAGSVDSAHGGGGGGAQGGSGGAGYLGSSGGTGVGGGTNGTAGAATHGGAGAGSGGSTGGGSGTRGGAAGGTSYAAGAVAGPVFTGAFNAATGAVLVTYSVADPDLQPTLVAPANGSYVDMSAAGSITFTRESGTQSGTLTGWALRRKSSGSYSYWKASTGTWTSSVVYNAPTTLTALGTNTYRYTFASGKWTDGTTYQWNVSTQGTLTGHAQNGPFASTDFTANATTMPTVTITSPSTTATTGTPTVSWTHTLGATKSQTKYRVVIYTKVQASSGGFSPGVTAAVWDSGLTSGATTSVVVGTTLVNGTTYVAYVQITETGPIASAWTPKPFKVAFTPPATPSFTATPTTGANTHPEVSLVVTGSGTLTTATIERSTNGTTWTPVRGGTGAPLLHDTLTLVDQECPLGAAAYYRARVSGVSTTQVIVSAWATQTVTLPNAQFWIGDPTTPTSFIPLWRAPTQSSSMSGGGAASMTLQQTQVQGSFRCFGRSTYVTVFGTLMDEEFTLTLDFFTTALYQEFLALRAENITVLVQSDMPGEQYYVTFGGTRPMSIMRASTRKVTPIRQLTMHCYPATAPT